MPNSRRRRFSVHNGIKGCKETSKNSTHSSSIDATLDNNSQSVTIPKPDKPKIKSVPSNTTKAKRSLSIIGTNTSLGSIEPIKKKRDTTTVDKDVTASASNIDLFNTINLTDEFYLEDIHESESSEEYKKPPSNYEYRRDRHVRHHRIKVRSPKRVPHDIQPKSLDIYKQNTGTVPIDWNQEMEVGANRVTTIDALAEDERASDHSMDDMCRICHGGDSLSQDLGQLISACACRGTVGRVHVKCLERWLTESGKSRCELCGTRYATRRVHRYGVPKALIMWILSQNAKQLMVDSLGIMLMSPLAVLAAWLSGRTLAGLMTQDNHTTTPWPLASTFVLACMTLVCYYCWIVSAATRHALGWWIWYRSQYEVRLTIQENE